MARRESMQEAQDLLAQLQVDYPNKEFRITDRSTPRILSPVLVAERGYQIIEQRPAPKWPVALLPAYDVQQVEHCDRCGAEILTDAIGEVDVYYCHECKPLVDAAREAEHTRRVEESRRKVDFADRYMRDGGAGWGVD